MWYRAWSPASDLVTTYRSDKISWDQFSAEYLRGLELRWDEVLDWLLSLNPDDDITLLCHEHEGELCHRQLVAKVVRKHQPDIPTLLH